MKFLAVAAQTLLLVGCAKTSFFPDTGSGSGDGLGPITKRSESSDGAYRASEGGYYAGEPVVYAHSSDKLYKVDPDTLKVTLIAPFVWPDGSDEMTDIALDKAGHMIGISYTTVYSVNTKTAACARLAELDKSGFSEGFNGLSFIFSEIADGKEALWAAGLNGAVAEVNPKSGLSKAAGSYKGPGSSGDIVSVKGLGTFATVKKAPFGGGTDWLARISTLDGQATLIGDIGFQDIWGLGFWKKKFYGFTQNGEFVLIDPKTGKGTLVSKDGPYWWGAGVTTAAPVID